MKSYCIILLLIIASLFAQEQTFKLKDGTIIVGEIQSETERNFNVITKFGTITIDKNEIIKTQHQVKLNTGETLIGEIINENPETIILKTKMGELTLPNSDISNIEEILDPKEKQSGGGFSLIKDSEFALGEEQLTDLFFDATGYTLKRGVFYISGLSFGFGISDKFDITTKWFNYVIGDLNIRPKYKLFEKGNWEKQQAFSIGAHFHANDFAGNRYVWEEGTVDVYEYTGSWGDWGADNCPQPQSSAYEITSCYKQTAPRKTVTKYYGGQYKIGSESNDNYDYAAYSKYEPEGYDKDAIDVYYEGEPYDNYHYYSSGGSGNTIQTIELFGAYTFSKVRSQNMQGRISHTLGGSMVFAAEEDGTILLYRIYYGLDLDINKKMKMIGEVFYDPSFMDPWDNGIFEGYYEDRNLHDTPVEKWDIFPLHLDFGFMYAFNESLRIGLHFQKPIIAFYWKF